jgi:hypothetical protein
MTLQEINNTNKELLEENKKLSNIIYDVDIIHFQRIDIKQAQQYNEMLKTINKELKNKLREIYDL